jgi:hypothetical protein
MADAGITNLYQVSTMAVFWLTLAYIVCVVGFAWLALAMESHWQQVGGGTEPPGTRTVWMLRVAGALALLSSLLACLRADHASMAALVWVLMLAAAAMTVALTLTWRPHWLCVFMLRIPLATKR